MATLTEVGLELVFLPNPPRSKWKEFRVQQHAIEAAAQFNSLLRSSPEVRAYRLWKYGDGSIDNTEVPPSAPHPFWAKADTFRAVNTNAYQGDDPPQPHPAWCVEINSVPLEVAGFKWADTTLAKALRALYSIAANLKLYPFVESTSRSGLTKQWPTGGGHLHIPVNMWYDDAEFLLRLYFLERNLCVDYSNRPYIRWSFSQWTDNINSAVAIKPKDLSLVHSLRRRRKITHRGATSIAHTHALDCHAIKQRLARTGKNLLPTYEFRFFDMPHSAEELALQVRFLSAWVDHHLGKQETKGARNSAHLHWEPPLTLTTRQYNRLAKDARYAERECVSFFKSLGLDLKDYREMCWERQYIPRMRWGKAV